MTNETSPRLPVFRFRLVGRSGMRVACFHLAIEQANTAPIWRAHPIHRGCGKSAVLMQIIFKE